MVKIAHIINVTEITEAKKSSYLHVAQPVTMKTMILAKERAKNSAQIQLVAIKHKDENLTIPTDFEWAPDIDKHAWEYIDSLQDVPRKPLPRLWDIIRGLYEFSDADFFIYTNLDIGLYPQFYLQVIDLINQGYDAFCINRRDLPKKYKGVFLDDNDIAHIYSTEGKGIKHPGIDCFIFKRQIVPSLELGNVYIGFPPVGQVLKSQVEKNSNNFSWIKGKAWTFHIGIDSPWQRRGPYFSENYSQSEGLYEQSIDLPTAVWYRLQCRLSTLLG